MRRALAALLLPGLAALALAAPALAESHAVTIRNGGGETIRAIQFGGGESRLRRELPQGAEARITYSTSCRTDIRIVYASGRTEDHGAVEVCTDPRITAGQGGAAGPTVAAPVMAAPTMAAPGGSGPKPGADPKLATQASATLPAKAPPPVVPPWTGKSITRRFGGLD